MMPVDNDRFRKMCVWLMPQRKRCQILLAIDVKPYGPTQGQGAEGFKLHPLPGGFQERDLTRCPNTRDLLIPSTSLDETDIIDIIWWPVRIILFRICVWKRRFSHGIFCVSWCPFQNPKEFRWALQHSPTIQTQKDIAFRCILPRLSGLPFAIIPISRIPPWIPVFLGWILMLQFVGCFCVFFPFSAIFAIES